MVTELKDIKYTASEQTQDSLSANIESSDSQEQTDPDDQEQTDPDSQEQTDDLCWVGQTITSQWLKDHPDLEGYVFSECIFPSGSFEVHGEPDFEYCDLEGCDFGSSDLGRFVRCDMRGSNISMSVVASVTDCLVNNMIGDGVNVYTLQLPRWSVVVCGDHIAIGCKQMTYSEWLEYEPFGYDERMFRTRFEDLITLFYKAVTYE